MERNLYVVIVTRNSKIHVRETLPQIVRHVEGQCRIIIVDNGSTDGTIELIKEQFPNLYIIENKGNLGKVKAINIGIKFALANRASHVVLLAINSFIDEQFARYIVEKKADIIAPVIRKQLIGKQIFIVGRRVSNFFMVPKIQTNDIQPPASYNTSTSFVTFQAMAIKRAVFEKIGLFDDAFTSYFADIDFCLRAKQHNCRLGIEPRALIADSNEAIDEKLRKIQDNILVTDYLRFLKKHAPMTKRVVIMLFRYVTNIFVSATRKSIQPFSLEY